MAVQSMLAGADIRSQLIGTDPGVALSMGGAPTDSLIRVLVSEADLPRAQQLLEQHDQEAKTRTAWRCDRCDEPNEPTFEYCWNCQAKRSNQPIQDAQQEIVPATENPEPVASELPDQPFSIKQAPREKEPLSRNPYQASELPDHRTVRVQKSASSSNNVTDDNSEAAIEHYEHAIRRAMLASVCGLIVFPPLLWILPIFLMSSLPPRPKAVPAPKLKIAFIWSMTAVSFLIGCSLILLFS
ncbi:hypothetical protein [Stieleria sp. JC731]|uniref:DUF7577 domain-containing protein n=1 Tax=Pirellulaceae TaxID=2691357 RepID=UPI001E4421CD|nr:hypothetical protein [Stieleria sp. JC731]